MNKKEIHEDLFDLAMRYALQDIVDEQEQEAELLYEKYRGLGTFKSSVRFDLAMKNNIKRAKKLSRGTGRKTLYLNRLLIAALVCIFVAVSVQAVRRSPFRFFRDKTPSYTSIEQVGMFEDQVLAKVRVSHYVGTYFYFPEKIPQGFSPTKIDISEKVIKIEFTADHKKFIFSQRPLDEQWKHMIVKDSEQAKESTKHLNKQNLHIIEKKGHLLIEYSQPFAYLSFFFENIEQDEAVEIASSVKENFI